MRQCPLTEASSGQIKDNLHMHSRVELVSALCDGGRDQRGHQLTLPLRKDCAALAWKKAEDCFSQTPEKTHDSRCEKRNCI